ncbi:hypothetical protein Tco_1134896 [Tanacetum coccineum]
MLDNRHIYHTTIRSEEKNSFKWITIISTSLALNPLTRNKKYNKVNHMKISGGKGKRTNNKTSENQEDTRGRGGKIQKQKRKTTEDEGSSNQVNEAYWKKFNIWYRKLTYWRHNSPEQEPTHSSPHDSPLTGVNPSRSEEGSLKLADLMDLCTSLQRKVDALEKDKLAQANEILSLKKRVEKLEKMRKSKPLVLKRLRKIGFATRVESSEEASLGAEENASKQGGMIYDIDADAKISLVDETQRLDDDLILDTTADLGGEEVVVKPAKTGVCPALDVEVSTAEPAVTTVSSLVTTDSVTITTVEPVSAAAKELTDNHMTMAKALANLKTSKPKVVTTMTTMT